MKRIFITGGRGFIGTRMCQLFENLDDHDVFVFDIQDNLLHDVRNYQTLSDAVDLYQPTHLIHLGMTSKVKDADRSAIYAKESILGGTLNVLEVARKYGKLDRMVFASSSTVYGNFLPALSPPTEEHPTNPVNIYGALKLCAEILIKSYHEMYDMEYTIVRPSSVYGPFDMNLRVIGKFFIDAMTKGIIQVNGKDMSVDFSYIDDVAEGIVAATLLDGGKNQTFNITRGQTRTLLEAAELVQSYVYCDIMITEQNALFPVRGAFDISKARDLLGYNPRIDLPGGIQMYAVHMRSHIEDYT